MYKNIDFDPLMADGERDNQRQALLSFVENVNGLLKPRLTGLEADSAGRTFQTEIDKLHGDRVILTVRYGHPDPDAATAQDTLADRFQSHSKQRDSKTLHLSACLIDGAPVVLVSNECDREATEVPQDYRAVYSQIERFSKQVADPAQHGHLDNLFENIRSKCAPSQANAQTRLQPVLESNWPRRLQEMLRGRGVHSLSEMTGQPS